MRAELPWNVAGIPPEAREAARAAARREGLSVGEWLTRRILRSFSGMEEEFSSMPYDRTTASNLSSGLDRPSLDRSSGLERSGLDPWGLPQSAASRRDTEEMLARVSRSEAESSDSYRRIEDQLRGVARRLDSSERSQSESNRVLSKTAAEINIAAREQAQAVDQLSNHLMLLSERLERVERNAQQDGLKDAVKGLHQGLSRLADQVSNAATQSASQVSALAGNMEQLAARLDEVRNETEESGRVLEHRLVARLDQVRGEVDESGRVLEHRLAARLDQVRGDIDGGDRGLEQRLAQVEKSAHFSTNALDHTLEKIEALANQRANDLVEAQRRASQTEESLVRLEEAVASIHHRGPDPALEQRLASIEHGISDSIQRLELAIGRVTPAVEDQMVPLSQRLDVVEKHHNDLLNELRARLRPEPAQPVPQKPAFQEPVLQPQPVFAAPEAPPFAEPAAFAQPGFDSDGFGAQPFESRGFEPPAEAAPDYAEDNDPFAPVSEFVDPFTPAELPPLAENFLSAARRSAKAASEPEPEQASRFSAFRLSRGEAAEGALRSRFLIPLVIALIVLLGLAAGIVLSQRLHGAAPVTPPPAPAPSSSQASAPPPVSLAPDNNPGQNPGRSNFVPAPPSHVPAAPHIAPRPQPQQAAPQQQTQNSGALPNGNPAPNVPRGPLTLDRAIQLANSGNPIAATVIGLRLLDGNGVAANPAEAFKWLSKAAQAGQAVAQYRLGTMYERGQGLTADPVQAAKWYEASANLGNRKAMHNLAVANASGALGKKNMPEAARWFAKAAGLGLSDSQFNLAVLYERGDGVPQSLLDAYKWYAIASAQGDNESKQRLQVLGTQLSDDDRNAAQKSATSFHAAPLSRSANVPPDVTDLAAQ